jgi:hypothetical protein
MATPHQGCNRAPVRTGERPSLAGNDPVEVIGSQRQQTVTVATAKRCEESLATRTFSSMLIGYFPSSFTGRIDLTATLLTE